WSPGAVERAVPARLVKRHLTEPVHRAGQLHLHFPVEIREVQELEFAVGEKRADHQLVLGNILGPVLGRRAQGIWPASIDWLRKQMAIRGDDIDLKTLQRDRVADLHDRPLRLADTEITVAPSLIGRLDEVAAIETPADRNQL